MRLISNVVGIPAEDVEIGMAVAEGIADVVVVYRAFNERSGHRFGTGVQDRPVAANAEASHFSWYAPFGLRCV